jgi:hypothetical protein
MKYEVNYPCGYSVTSPLAFMTAACRATSGGRLFR